MKRNELFKSLMNVQSQVTSLMNAVLEEGPYDGGIAAGKAMLGALVPEKIQSAVKDGFGATLDVSTCKKIAAEFSARTAENSDLQKLAEMAPNPKVLAKVQEMTDRLGGDINHQDFLSTCKYMGVAAIALGCIFGYMLFPTMKNGLIAAFNSGNPDLERLGGLLKSLAASTLVVGLVVFGGILLYHAFRSDNLNAAKNPLLASILQALNNVSKAIKNKFQSPIKPVDNKAWQW